MRENFYAIPTEYDGVLYRSKAEAQFALYLNLWHEDRERYCALQYEPNELRIGEYIPDFVNRHPDYYWSVVFEYKPAKPTNVYVKRLSYYFDAMDKLDRHAGSYMLFWGNAYRGDSGYSFYTRASGWDDRGDWVSEYRDRILSYRFDLEARQ